MGISNMQGTSAFIEYIGPKGRKYRSSCYYNKNGTCLCGKSSVYMSKCVGRIYCSKYKESTKKLNSSYGKNEKLNDTYNSHKGILYKVITLKNIKTCEVIKVTIVPDNKVDKLNRKYSVDSEFGKALRNKNEGNEIFVRVGANYIKYEILKIEYM